MPRALLASLLAATALAGCGGGDEPATPAAPAAAAKQALTVDIASFKFRPAKATVARGATITFTNSDKAPHTATAEDGSFDTDRLEQSQRKKITLDKPGTYRYYCAYHRFMQAVVTVK